MEKAAAWRARRGDGITQSAASEAAAVERTGLWGLWWMVINLVLWSPPLKRHPKGHINH